MKYLKKMKLKRFYKANIFKKNKKQKEDRDIIKVGKNKKGKIMWYGDWNVLKFLFKEKQ